MNKLSQIGWIAAALVTMGASLPLVGCGDRFDDHHDQVRAPALEAAFEVSTTRADAGQVVTFDASATRVDGEAVVDQGLVYSWSFGDDTYGGTRQISHIYARGGHFEATLTVSDDQGRTSTASREITVDAPTFAPGDGQLNVQAKTPDDRPLPAATVSVHGIAATASTDGYGKARIEDLPSGEALYVHVEKPGYIRQVKRVEIDPARDQALVAVTMQPVGERIEVADVEDGATVRWRDGARVELPADAVVDANGQPVSGAIDVVMTVFNATTGKPSGFPGMFVGLTSTGDEKTIVSHGAIDVTLERDGERLQIAPGKAATIDIPIYTVGYQEGDTLDLWSLDETTGVWIQEGSGVVTASAQAPGGLVLRGQAAHFTPWNADTWVNTPCKERIDLRCHDENDDLVKLPVPPSATVGTVSLNVDPVDGYADSCTPSSLQRHTGSYRHGTTFPDGTGLEGQMCEKQNGQWVADISCKAADGTYPSDIECNQNTVGSSGITVGVCRDTSNSCPDYMYCGEVDADRDGAIDAQPGCTPPMYRIGYYDSATGEGVKVFQNWNGWHQTIDATRLTMEVETPWTTISGTADLTINGRNVQTSFDVTPDPPPGFSQLPPPTDPSVGPQMADTLPEYCTSEPVVIDVGECSPTSSCQPDEDANECCDENDQIVPCDTCQEDPANNICCENDQQVPCEPYVVVVECDPENRAGENDLDECSDGSPGNVCEVDALVVQHTGDDGFTSEKYDPSDVQIAGSCGDADAARLSTADYAVCDPSAQAWKSTVAYFDDKMYVTYDKLLVEGDLLRIFRQAVGANDANGDGELCRASGTVTVYIERNGRRGQAIVANHYNTFERRIQPEHLP